MNFGNAQSSPEGPGEPYSPQSTTTDAMSDSCTTICSQLRRGGRAVEPSNASSMRSNPSQTGQRQGHAVHALVLRLVTDNQQG